MADEGVEAEGWATGIIVCVTGLTSSQRDSVQKSVVEAGGRYTPELNRQCTHLIAAAGVLANAKHRNPSRINGASDTAAISRKLLLAHVNRLKWPTQVVSLAWLYDSCRGNSKAPELEYAFNGGGDCSVNTAGSLSEIKESAIERKMCTSRLSRSPRTALADMDTNQLPRAQLRKPLGMRRTSSSSCVSPLVAGSDSLRRRVLLNKRSRMAASSTLEADPSPGLSQSPARRRTRRFVGSEASAAAKITRAEVVTLREKAAALSLYYDTASASVGGGTSAAQGGPLEDSTRTERKGFWPDAPTESLSALPQRPFLLSHARIHRPESADGMITGRGQEIEAIQPAFATQRECSKGRHDSRITSAAVNPAGFQGMALLSVNDTMEGVHSYTSGEPTACRQVHTSRRDGDAFKPPKLSLSADRVTFRLQVTAIRSAVNGQNPDMGTGLVLVGSRTETGGGGIGQQHPAAAALAAQLSSSARLNRVTSRGPAPAPRDPHPIAEPTLDPHHPANLLPPATAYSLPSTISTGFHRGSEHTESRHSAGVPNERNLSSASLAERLQSLACLWQSGEIAGAAAQLPANFQKPDAHPPRGLRIPPPSRGHPSTATLYPGLLPAPNAPSGLHISKSGGNGEAAEGGLKKWQAPGGSCPAAVPQSSVDLIARLQAMRQAAQPSRAPVGSATAPAPITAQVAIPAIAAQPQTGSGSEVSRDFKWKAEGSIAGRFRHSAASGGQQRVVSCNSAAIPSTEHPVAHSPAVPAGRMPSFGAALLAEDDPDGLIRGDSTTVPQPAIVEASADVSNVEAMIGRSYPTGANEGGKLAEFEGLLLSASGSVSDCQRQHLSASASDCQSFPEAVSLATAAVSDGPEDACLEAVKSVFDGIRAIFDPDIEQADADRARTALAVGGGEEVVGAYLGSAATHVVCRPEAAVKWLSMGMNIVSPQWVLRSAATGSLQRVLTLSMDASRQLPSSYSAGIISSINNPGNGGGSGGGESPAVEMLDVGDTALAERSAREALVLSLAQLESLTARDGPVVDRASPTPAVLMEGLLWAVTQQVDSARLERAQPHLLHHRRTSDIIPDSEDEGDDDEEGGEMLSCTQQEAVAIYAGHKGFEESSERESTHAGVQLQPSDWDEVVYKAGSITLLCPVDNLAAGTHFSLTLAAPCRGLTRRALLEAIAAWYAAPVALEEQMTLMRGRGPGVLLVRAAYVDLVPLSRGSLVGSRCCFEGLFKVQRDGRGTIYELRLAA